MEKGDLVTLLREAVQRNYLQDISIRTWLGPIEDPRAVIASATMADTNVILTVSADRDLVSLASEYRRYEKAVADKNVVHIPEVVKAGTLSGSSDFLIQRQPESAVGMEENIIPLDRFPMGTSSEIGELASLYWRTVSEFPVSYGIQPTSEEYFERRLAEWRDSWPAAIDAGYSRKEYVQAAEDLVMLEGRGLPMTYFFDVFGNTDITKVRTGKNTHRYYLWNTLLVHQPRDMAVAMSIWNACLYACRELDPLKWEHHFDFWIRNFIDFAPGIRQRELKKHLRVFFSERYLASLADMVSVSPFDTGRLAYPENIECLLRYALH